MKPSVENYDLSVRYKVVRPVPGVHGWQVIHVDPNDQTATGAASIEQEMAEFSVNLEDAETEARNLCCKLSTPSGVQPPALSIEKQLYAALVRLAEDRGVQLDEGPMSNLSVPVGKPGSYTCEILMPMLLLSLAE